MATIRFVEVKTYSPNLYNYKAAKRLQETKLTFWRSTRLLRALRKSQLTRHDCNAPFWVPNGHSEAALDCYSFSGVKIDTTWLLHAFEKSKRTLGSFQTLKHALRKSKLTPRSSIRLLSVETDDAKFYCALRKWKLTLQGCYALFGSQNGHSEPLLGFYALYGSQNWL